MARHTPQVAQAALTLGPPEARRTIEVGSADWFAWLDTASSFTFVCPAGSFTARRERASSGRGGWYWRAYRRHSGALKREYLGRAAELTLDRLQVVAARLTVPGQAFTASQKRPPASPLPEPSGLPTTEGTAAGSLLQTKLYAPPVRHKLVARPALLSRFQGGLRGKLTLISAPAGFGKTTLVSAWRATPAGSTSGFAWVALDGGDNDPLRFWRYVVTALARLTPAASAVLALLAAPRPPPTEAILPQLINALSEAETDVVLVLDDYHVIDAPAIHQTLAALLEHLPPRLHLVLTTRADPLLPLARLRARGELTELRADDLRFTADEAAAFLVDELGLPLTPAQVALLEARTEGWVAGLQLAALAVRSRHDPDGFIAEFAGSHHFVVDYLAEEVLSGLPQHLQQFLLCTSILERMCGPLCDALLLGEQAEPQGAYSQLLLEELERSNLFVVRLDDSRQWYRYHQLFAGVLRGRLTSGATAEQVMTLHRRASRWFATQGLLAEAVEHALAAHDSERAAQLIERHGETVWMHGGLSALLGWLRLLPGSAFEGRPKLALDHAFLLAASDQFPLSERRLTTAEEALQADPTPDPALLGQAAAIRAAIGLLTEGPAAAAIATGRRALELLPPSEASWRSHARVILGASYYVQAGEVGLAIETLLEAERVGLAAGDALMAASAAVHVSLAYEIAGRLHEAERRDRRALQQAAEPFWRGVPLAGYARLGLGRVLYARNELRAAREHFTAAVAELELWAIKRPAIIAAVGLACVNQALGQPGEANSWMERVAARVQKDDLRQTFAHWAAQRVRLALAQGELAKATLWAHEIEPGLASDLDPAQEFEHITLAQIYLAQGRFVEAKALLERLLRPALDAGRLGRALRIELLLALAADGLGHRDSALAALERALRLAAPEGFVRVFVEAGSPMQALLRTAAARGVMAEYVAVLLVAFNERSVAARPAPPAWRVEAPLQLVEPLTSREQEVLRLLAEGASNSAIAEALVISVGTAKKHVNNILGKLELQSRTQAAIWAREHGMLVEQRER